MRIASIFILSVFLLMAGQSSVLAAKRPSRGYKDYGKKEEPAKTNPEKRVEEKRSEISESDPNVVKPLIPEQMLLKMLAYEASLGILDCTADVVEVTTSPTTNIDKSVRKQIYFLAPTRTLTVKDGIPIYYVDESLFQQIIAQVDLEQQANETINGIECLVIKMIPRDDVFSQNVKHYYLAKDDFRKIRIESVRFKSSGDSIYNVTDFNYHLVDGQYLLPLNSESRMYDDRDFLLQSTKSTFLHWKFNTGLSSDFFDRQLQGYKLYEVVK